MKPIQGFYLITPGELHWRLSNLMRLPNADYLERTGSENLGARLWRLPPKSANTLHKHIRAEEFYVVLEGMGRLRVGDETLTVPRYGGVLVGPDLLRQVFNDTDADVLWLIIGAPEEVEFLAGSKSTGMDLSLIYPVEPTQLPKELRGVQWPPDDSAPPLKHEPPPIDFERYAREWIAAWNASDLERILQHYADHVEFFSPFITRLTGNADGVVHGLPALRDYFARGLAAYPQLHFEFIRLYPGVRSCVLEYHSVNRLRAVETIEFDAAGKACRVQAHFAGS